MPAPKHTTVSKLHSFAKGVSTKSPKTLTKILKGFSTQQNKEARKKRGLGIMTQDRKDKIRKTVERITLKDPVEKLKKVAAKNQLRGGGGGGLPPQMMKSTRSKLFRKKPLR